MVVQVAVAIVDREGSGAEHESKRGMCSVATKKGKRWDEEYCSVSRKKSNLWMSGGRFRCNQSFAGATELAQEMKCQDDAWQTGTGGEEWNERWGMGA
jgi:hypothetical protein